MAKGAENLARAKSSDADQGAGGGASGAGGGASGATVPGGAARPSVAAPAPRDDHAPATQRAWPESTGGTDVRQQVRSRSDAGYGETQERGLGQTSANTYRRNNVYVARMSRRQAALSIRVSLVCNWSDEPSCGALAFTSPEFQG